MQKNCLPLFAQKVFEAYWERGLDISDENILTKIAQEAGLSPRDFKQYIGSQEAKDLLMSNSSQLIEKRGFGSPTFFYRDHMFFGNDRLHLLEEVIRKELI
jgi:2-hydroxychromene-2-carboxylate isomerase